MHMQRMMRRRHRGWRLLAVVAVFTIGYLGIVLQAIMFKSHLGASIDDDTHLYSRKLLATNTTDDDGGFQYPPDAFSIAQRKKGAVVLHVIGLIYMFVALAIVCDEFFVPSLSVITDKLKISEDVAGATFMAAGGSAPELFTSLIGVFFAKNNVGIGTIVGSAVFNILFVIGMCALFSKTVLELTWWPLFRDVTFYSIDLAVLIGFFEDEEIQWWEALILFALYLSYVIFMKFNTTMEDFVKTKLLRRKARVHSNDSLLNEAAPPPLPQAPAAPSPLPQAPKPNRRCSIPILHSGTNHFRHGVLQLMIHTVDPISECQVQEKAIKLHAVASVNLLIDESPEHEGQNGNANGTADKNSNKKQMQVHAISNGHMPSESPVGSTNFSTQFVSPMTAASTPTNDAVGQSSSTTRQSNRTDNSTVESPQNEENQEGAGILDDDSEPLDMSWPKTWRKRITYVIVAPLIVPMWLLLPDTRRPEKKKWFMVTFFGSIIFIFIYSYLVVWWANQTATVWTVPTRKEKKKWFMVTFFGSIIFIFIYSYLMVWWANQTGETMDIPDEVMGLTILAAGTSIPDLITSVIVAKKGFGDMAVSSSVGSNIFDITVGLPIPWLLYWMAFQKPINVESNGLVCSIILLFAMLLTVVITIAVSKWKMTKIMGGAMLGLYGVFVVLSVLLELDVISCFIN